MSAKPASQRIPLKATTPSFFGLVVALLLVDLAVVLLLLPNESHFVQGSYAPIGIGLLIGQFGLMGAIRLRYDSQRWLAYGAMVALAGIGAILFGREVGPREFTQLLLLYLLGVMLLAVVCIVPGAIAQARYRVAPEDRYRFQLKYVLALFVVLSTLFVILPWLLVLFSVAFSVVLLSLPVSVANVAMVLTISIRRYSWCLWILLSGLTLLVLPMGNHGGTTLFGLLVGQGVTVWIGGIYLMSFRRDPKNRPPARLPSTAQPIEEKPN